MAYCTNCGKPVERGDSFCSNCGKAVGNVSVNTNADKRKAEEASTAAWAVLGFFIPIVGLILWLVWTDEYPKKAKSAGKGALISVIVSVSFMILYFVLIFVLMTSVVTGSVLY